MRTVFLKNTDVVAVVDDDDYARVAQYVWSLQSRRGLFYAVRYEKKKAVFLHRFVMGVFDERLVDHKNGDGLNNQKNNLRLCSHAENMRNSVKRITSKTSRFKGVFWMPFYNSSSRRGKPRAKPWVAQVMFNRRKISRFFSSEEDAARGYDSLAREFHGDFASLNFA